MKKNVSCLILAALFFFCACRKNAAKNDVILLSPVTKEVVQSPTVIGMRQAYALLTIEEKESLWLQKFSTILKNDRDKLSVAQLNIVKELQSFLLTNGMSKLHKTPVIGEEFIKSRLNTFQQHFSQEQLFMLIECPYFNSKFSIFQSAATINSLQSNEKMFIGTASANLSVRPDCTCYYSISCSGSGNNCEDKKDECLKKPECGLFGTSNCTGRCTNDVNPT